MITIARMSSFLLMTSIICKATISMPNIRELLSYDYKSIILIINPIVILMMLYFIVAFSNVPALKKYRDSKKFHKIELWSQFVLFTIFVFYNGGVKNQFKFIYLFFIIRCTIEIGKSAGTMVSLSSSAIILLMDLFMEQNSNINIFFENDIVLSALFILTAWLLGYYVNEEKEHKSYLQELANKDGVTGTYNHRFFYSFLHDENLWDRNQHNKISMMFIDIDDFKIYKS